MNYRNTKQKVNIYNAIVSCGHVKCETLLNAPSLKDISRATIYRNLSILQKQGLIRLIKIDNEKYYEAIKMNHYHFLCSKCHQIYDLDPSLIDLKHNIKAVEKIELTFLGVCNSCLRKE